MTADSTPGHPRSRPWRSRHRERKPLLVWELLAAPEGRPRRRVINRVVAELASKMWSPDRSPRPDPPRDVATDDGWSE